VEEEQEAPVRDPLSSSFSSSFFLKIIEEGMIICELIHSIREFKFEVEPDRAFGFRFFDFLIF